MKFRKDVEFDNHIECIYDDEKKMSPIMAYQAMISFLEKIHDQDGEVELGDLIPQLFFREYGETDYARSWKLWEEAVIEELENEKKKNK